MIMQPQSVHTKTKAKDLSHGINLKDMSTLVIENGTWDCYYKLWQNPGVNRRNPSARKMPRRNCALPGKFIVADWNQPCILALKSA